MIGIEGDEQVKDVIPEMIKRFVLYRDDILINECIAYDVLVIRIIIIIIS